MDIGEIRWQGPDTGDPRQPGMGAHSRAVGPRLIAQPARGTVRPRQEDSDSKGGSLYPPGQTKGDSQTPGYVWTAPSPIGWGWGLRAWGTSLDPKAHPLAPALPS